MNESKSNPWAHINPRSCAGTILREFGSLPRAIDYANRMAGVCAMTGSPMAGEYKDAANVLRFALGEVKA